MPSAKGPRHTDIITACDTTFYAIITTLLQVVYGKKAEQKIYGVLEYKKDWLEHLDMPKGLYFLFFLYILPGAGFRTLSAGVHCTLWVAG